MEEELFFLLIKVFKNGLIHHPRRFLMKFLLSVILMFSFLSLAQATSWESNSSSLSASIANDTETLDERRPISPSCEQRCHFRHRARLAQIQKEFSVQRRRCHSLMSFLQRRLCLQSAETRYQSAKRNASRDHRMCLLRCRRGHPIPDNGEID